MGKLKSPVRKSTGTSFTGANGFDLMHGAPIMPVKPSTTPKIFVPGQRLNLGMDKRVP